MCDKDALDGSAEGLVEKSPFSEPFLLRLKEVIDADQSLSPSRLSLAAGLSNAAIRHWFSGQTKGPTLSNARKICAALGTTLEEFLSDTRAPEEIELVQLLSQLSAEDRQRLIGYAQGLADSTKSKT